MQQLTRVVEIRVVGKPELPALDNSVEALDVGVVVDEIGPVSVEKALSPSLVRDDLRDTKPIGSLGFIPREVRLTKQRIPLPPDVDIWFLAFNLRLNIEAFLWYAVLTARPWAGPNVVDAMLMTLDFWEDCVPKCAHARPATSNQATGLRGFSSRSS
jgi:hypothetical protein